jgi:protein-tyrosine-phosphatase
MSDQTGPYNILFLCTNNSARSVMAECVVDRLGRGKFKGYSAGSHPSGAINPIVKNLLQRMNFPVDDLKSKSWNDFATPGAPAMDFVITVCDQAAGEVCPVWPGQPMTAHWGFPDPSSFDGTEPEKAAFTADVYRMIERRIDILVNLPIAGLESLKIQQHLNAIGKSDVKAEASATSG